MKKVLSFVFGAFAALTMQAELLEAPQTPLPLTLTEPTAIPEGVLKIEKLSDDCVGPMKAAAKNNESGESVEWGEWSEVGAGRFPDSFMDSYYTTMDYYEVSYPEWDGSFTLEKRTDMTGNAVQLCLRKVFAGVDIVLDLDPVNNFVSCELQTSGLAVPTDAEYEYAESMFYCTGSQYFPESGKILFRQLYLLLNETSGFRWLDVALQLDGGQPIEFTPTQERRLILEGESPVVTVNVTRSPEVAFYRVIVKSSFLYTELMDISSPTPSDASLYSEYSGDSFTVTVPEDKTDFYITVIPFGVNKTAVDNYKVVRFYVNPRPSHQWTSLGKGEIKEVITHTLLPSFLTQDSESGECILPALSREVEIQEAADAPGLYRVCNPFGPEGYPGEIYEHLYHYEKIEPGHNYYLYIDATDPSRVYVNYSITGLSYQRYNFPHTLQSLRDSHNFGNDYFDKMNAWGKMADKRIAFPLHSLAIFNYEYNQYLKGFPYELELFLPGYESYEMSWVKEEADEDDEKQNVTLKVTHPSITEVRATLLPEVVLEDSYYKYFPERIYEMVAAANKSIVSYKVGDTKEVTVSLTELGDLCDVQSTSRIVVIQVDSNGKVHGGLIGTIYKDPLDKWTSLGDAVFEENVLLGIFGNKDINTSHCEVMVNDFNPSLYKLVNAYEDISVNNCFGRPFQYTPLDLLIYAETPEKVYFVANCELSVPWAMYTGVYISSTYGQACINSVASCKLYLNQTPAPEDYGTMVDNVISFSGDQMLIHFPDYSSNLFYAPDCLFRVTLPKDDTSGIDNVAMEEDNDAAVNYYNLQGVRVANPENGIYIVRRGNKVSKEYVR